MKLLKLTIFTLLLCISLVTSAQEVTVATPNKYTSIHELAQSFSVTHNLQFSYDVERMQKSYILTPELTLSFSSFKELLKSIQVDLEEEDSDNYLLIQTSNEISYCAILRDKNTSFEIPDVLVMQGDSYLGTTDISGQINLEIMPGALITLSYTGYTTQNVIVTQKENCELFLLENNVQELDEIVLTNYLTRGIVKNKNSSLTVSPKALAILPGLVEPDIFQSLQLIPGISSPEEDPGALHIRGGTPDQNLILWDGIKMYQNSHFFNQISSFNPYITKKVNVYRGGTSVRYGDRISGVIDMQSDDDLFNGFKAGLGVNLLGGDAYLKIPISKKLGLLVAGRRSLTDLYESFTFNSLSSKVFQNSRVNASSSRAESGLNYFFSDYNIKLSYKPKEDHSYSWSFISVENQLKNISKRSENGIEEEAEDRLKRINPGGSFTWRREKQGFTTKQFQLYLSNYLSDYTFNNKITNTNTSENTSEEVQRENIVTELGYDLFYDIPFGKKHHVLLGHQTVITAVDNFVSNIQRDSNGVEEIPISNPLFGESNFGTKVGLIAYGEYRFHSEHVLFSAGVRTDYNNLSEQAITEPRIYSTVKVNNNLRLTGSLERKNQSFSQISTPEISGEGSSFFNSLSTVNRFWSDQSFAGDFFAPWVIQKSDQFTLGALYDKNGWSFELESYYKRINNTIPISDTFLTSIYFIENRDLLTTGKAKRFGIDLLVKKQILDYRVWMSYSFGKNNVKYEDLQSEYFPEVFDQRHRFNISQTYKYKRFEFALGWTYGSGLPSNKLSSGTINEINNIKANNLFYSKRLPDYHRLDLSSLYHFESVGRWNSKIGFSIRNLYNRKQLLQQTYSIVQDDNNNRTIKEVSNRTLGFTADLVFRISF